MTLSRLPDTDQQVELQRLEEEDPQRAGNQVARQWVDEHSDYLFRFASSRIADLDTVEELIQDTFLSAMRAYARFEGKSSIQTWLTGILRRKIADHFRRLQRENKILRPLGDLEYEGDLKRSERLKAWPQWEVSKLSSDEFWDVFKDCTSKLPPLLAEPFRLREIDELSTSQICQELGISANLLSTRMFRARTLLRNCLDKNWFHPGGSES